MAVRRALSTLTTPRGALILIAAYCLAHYATRLALSPVLTLDEAEQALMSQAWRMSYGFRQPPLSTWMYAGLEHALGYHRWAFHALKYLWLWAGSSAFYFAARRILASDRDAGLALGGLMMIGVVALLLHVDLTHSALMIAFAFITLHAFTRALQTGRLMDWLYLGAAIGLGVLSKYVYALLPLGLFLGAWAAPGLRRLIKPGGLAAALALAAAMIAPYAIWARQAGYSGTALAAEVIAADAPSLIAGWALGLGDLAVALALAGSPLILLFFLVYPRALIHLGETARWSGWRICLFAVLSVGALSGLAAVLLFGGADFKARWFLPVIAPLPIALMLSVRDLGLTRTPLRDAAFGALALLSVIGVLTFRWIDHALQPQLCQPECRTEQPIAAWAEDLRRAGFTGGTILTWDHHLAGNLRVLMPEARIISAAFPYPAQRAPQGGGQCWIVWNTLNLHRQDDLFAYAAEHLKTAPPRAAERVFVQPLPRNADYQMALNLRRATPTEACR